MDTSGPGPSFLGFTLGATRQKSAKSKFVTPPPPQYLGKGTPPTVGTRIFRLADQGFLLVPHSNYGSICYRLATIHFRDKQTDRQTDSTIAIAIRYLQ